MPARREYTPEELRERLERRREQTRQAVARHRQRRVSATVTLTGEQVTLTTDQVAPRKPDPPTPPALSPLSTRELERRLAPFAQRGYRPDPGFLSRLAAAYPGVDLELEVAAALDWLEEPRNAKRRCSKGFLKNWCAKADQDRKARESQSPPRPVRTGPVDPPIAFQTNQGPDPAPWLTGGLQTFTLEELKRLAAEHARVPFKDRLAAKAALATNGVHKA